MQRQRQQHAIARPGQALVRQRLDVGGDVGMAERDALGRAGGAGGVGEHREAGRIDLGQRGAVVAGERLPVLHRRRRGGRRGVVLLIVEQDQRRRRAALGPLEPGQGLDEVAGREDAPAAAVVENAAELAGGDLLVERHRDRAGAHDREERQHPLRPVGREQPDDLARPRRRRGAGRRRARARGRRARPASRPRCRPRHGRSAPARRARARGRRRGRRGSAARSRQDPCSSGRRQLTIGTPGGPDLASPGLADRRLLDHARAPCRACRACGAAGQPLDKRGPRRDAGAVERGGLENRFRPFRGVSLHRVSSGFLRVIHRQEDLHAAPYRPMPPSWVANRVARGGRRVRFPPDQPLGSPRAPFPGGGAAQSPMIILSLVTPSAISRERERGSSSPNR